MAWSDGTTPIVELTSQTDVCYRSGKPAATIRWVLVRDPQALLCPDASADPRQILQWFVLRWQLEVTSQEVRTHLGMETQRQWSERAIARTTPALFGLFSLVTLAADVLIEQQGGILPRTTAWYAKPHPTFADAIALVRRYIWAQQETFATSEPSPELIKLPRGVYGRMIDALAYAA